MKGSKSNLKKVEILISEAGYVLRYEKGNFKPGYCILEEKKVIVVNKFYPLEAKFKHRRSSQPTITWIYALTDVALTANNRYST